LLQQTGGRQHVTAISLNKQYTNVQKVDSQAEPTFETRLVFKARLLLVQSSQTPGLPGPASIQGPACIQGFTVSIFILNVFNNSIS